MPQQLGWQGFGCCREFASEFVVGLRADTEEFPA
jgi:hypothetical protein